MDKTVDIIPPVVDAVPTDYEFRLQSLNRNDPLLTYPPDTYTVTDISREQRLIDAGMPEVTKSYFTKHEAGSLPTFVKDSCTIFDDKWHAVERPHRKHGKPVPVGAVVTTKELPAHKFQIDVDSDKNPEKGKVQQMFQDLFQAPGATKDATPGNSPPPHDPLQPVMTENATPGMDDKNREDRQSGRQDLFKLFYDPKGENTKCKELLRTDIDEPYTGNTGITRLLVKAVDLQLTPPDLEPMFCSLALFDVKAKKRVSETFYFDVNAPQLNSMLGNFEEADNPITRARQCIFSVSRPHKDVFLVLRIEKVLEGEVDDVTEPYVKGETNEKSIKKMQENSKDICSRLGAYKQYFAWSPMPLFDDNGSLSIERPTRFNNLLRFKAEYGDDKVCEAIEDLKSNAPKKNRLLTGFMSLEITLLNEDYLSNHKLVNILDPSYRQLKPIGNEEKVEEEEEDRFGDDDVVVKGGDDDVVVRGDFDDEVVVKGEDGKPVTASNGVIKDTTLELQEFAVSPELVPAITYQNLLYIYPQLVDLRSRGGNLKVRNIAMKVQVMSDDADPHVPGLPIVYSHGCGEPLRSSLTTTVTYHSKNPSFYDEIKIELPPALTDKHHLLFTFYHITCKAPDKKGYNEVESVIAYAVCPLLEKGRFLPVDDYELPLAIDLPPHHLSKGDLIKYVDNKKPLFKIKTSLVSSVYARDYELYSFQRVYENPKATDQAMLTAINGLRKAKVEVIASNLPLLFSYLLDIIEKRGEQANETAELSLTQIPEAAFRVLASIVSTIEDSSGAGSGQHSPVLQTYLKFHIHAPKVYTALTALMVQALNSGLKSQSAVREPAGHRLTMRFNTVNRPVSVACATPVNSEDRPVEQTTEAKPAETKPADAKPAETKPVEAKEEPEKTEQSENKDEEAAAEVGKAFPTLHGQLFSSTLSRGLGAGGLEKAADIVLRHSWFFCDLIVKSMMQAVPTNTARNGRYSQKHLNNLGKLIKILSDEVVNRCRSGVALSKSLNRALGWFITDLFDVVDRGLVMQWVSMHTKALNMAVNTVVEAPLDVPVPTAGTPTIASPTAQPAPSPTNDVTTKERESSMVVLCELKFDFLNILANYEHYIPLNLPVAIDTLPPIPTLTNEFAGRHYLASLIVSEVVALFDSDNHSLRSIALVTLRDLLNKHDKDSRYNCEGAPLGTSLGITRSTALQRIATIYFPYVLAVIDAHDVIEKKWDLLQQRNGLICFVWILCNMPKALISSWWKSETPKRVVNFFAALRLVAVAFEYVGKTKLAEMNKQVEGQLRSAATGDAKSALENMYAGGAAAMRVRRTNTFRATSKDTLRNPAYKTRTLTRMGDIGLQASYDLKTEANLSFEFNIAILDLIDHYISDFKDTLTTDMMFDVLFELFIFFADRKQAEKTLTHLFRLLRCFIAKFDEVLFATGKNYLAKLCPTLIGYCNYVSEETRAGASGLLFVLMKHNFNQHQSFARMKLQTTIALSALIGPGIDDDFAICRALSTLREYARECKEPKLLEHSYSGKSFVEQTFELSSRLFDIVRDSMMISKHKGDAEMTADLYYAIAKSYMDTPGLRITYLRILLQFHEKQQNWAEAAYCTLHIAALVSEYIQMLEPTPGLPQGSADFKTISPNVLEEAITSKAAREADEEGMCEDDIFSVTGLTKLLLESIELLKKGQLYESADEVYKLLLPIYAKDRNYRAIADAHGDLKELFENIITTSKEESRTLGTYYRIGFYGVLWGDSANKEYIYKEPKITLLQEITNRLKSIYNERFGDGNFVIIQNSNKVDISTLDATKAYLQLTSVDPYFEAWEMKERQTYFDKRTKLTRFMFETPFTQDGKSHGTTSTQFKRKTILTVGNSFPYVKKRLQVVNEEQIILTPIENAIELIESRAEKFKAEVNAETPTTKQLQMMLSGTVRLQVNAGPFEICDTFLGSPDDYQVQHVRRLRKAFREFLKQVKEALVLNSRLISPSQVTYQKDLEKGFEELDNNINPYIKGEPEFLAKLKEKKAAKAAQSASPTSPVSVPPAVTA